MAKFQYSVNMYQNYALGVKVQNKTAIGFQGIRRERLRPLDRRPDVRPPLHLPAPFGGRDAADAGGRGRKQGRWEGSCAEP